MTENIVTFPVPRKNLSTCMVLDNRRLMGLREDLEECVVIGRKTDGSIYYVSCYSDDEDFLSLIEEMRLSIINRLHDRQPGYVAIHPIDG